MKTIYSYILERLMLKPGSMKKLRSDSLLIHKIIKAFKGIEPDIFNDQNLIKMLENWLVEKIDKYNFTLNKLNNFLTDAPDPIEDFDIDFDYRANDNSYIEFFAGPKVLGFFCNDIGNYFYIKD